jgi:hypothetical protein
MEQQIHSVVAIGTPYKAEMLLLFATLLSSTAERLRLGIPMQCNRKYPSTTLDREL